MSLRDEIEQIVLEIMADSIQVTIGKKEQSKETSYFTEQILSKFEKRINEMIEPYTDSETMLGKETLQTLKDVKDLLK